MTNTMAFTLRKNTVVDSSRMLVSSSDDPVYTENENCKVSDIAHLVR